MTIVGLLVLVVIAVAAYLHLSGRVNLLELFQQNLKAKKEISSDWLPDSIISTFSCDFAEISFLDFYAINELETKIKANALDRPILLKNATGDWAAFEKWKKSTLLNSFGNRSIYSGSESSVVYSGGTAGSPKTVRQLLEDISCESDNNCVDDFVFDTSVLKSIPELREDFKVLPLFSAWDNKERETQGIMWHMLSLGASRAGLPFHSHGQTWLALIHGMKQWYVYPPGFGPPEPLSYNPLITVHRWFNSVLPTWQHLPKPPANGDISAVEEGQYFRPLECSQMPGDIVILPSRWSHLTINNGETIAVGGQESLYAKDRVAMTAPLLERNPNQVEALKDHGLGLAHLAMQKQEGILKDFRENYRMNRFKLTMTDRKEKFNGLFTKTHDTFLVVEVPQTISKAASPTVRIRRNSVMFQLKRLMKRVPTLNIAVNEIFEGFEVMKEKEKDPTNFKNITFQLYFGERYVGEGEADPKYDPLHPLHQQLLSFSIEKEEEEFDEVKLLNKIDKINRANKLREGSVDTASVLAQREYEVALMYLRNATALRPQHPEIHGILCEVYGLMERLDDMRGCIADGVRTVEQMSHDGISKPSIASVYHKLATIYLQKNLPAEAKPLLLQSLRVSPDYVPARADYTTALLVMNATAEMKESLAILKKLSPEHETVKRTEKHLRDQKEAEEKERKKNIPATERKKQEKAEKAAAAGSGEGTGKKKSKGGPMLKKDIPPGTVKKESKPKPEGAEEKAKPKPQPKRKTANDGVRKKPKRTTTSPAKSAPAKLAPKKEQKEEL